MSGFWFLRQTPRPTAPVRIFCFAHAGGGASVFRDWGSALPDAEVFAAQIPGRGSRFGEPAVKRLDRLAQAVAAALPAQVDRPYALYGHSMGALLAFEVARELRRRGGPLPFQLLASGFPAPQLRFAEDPLHLLPDALLVEELGRRFGGMPDPVLDEPELREVVLPALRADLEALETHTHVAEPPLDCPISVFGGDEDETVSGAALEAWRAQTRAQFRLTIVPGGHFFIQTARSQFLAALRMELGASR